MGGSQVAGTARSKWAEENIAFSELSAPKVRMQQHRLSEELETIAGKLQQIAD